MASDWFGVDPYWKPNIDFNLVLAKLSFDQLSQRHFDQQASPTERLRWMSTVFKICSKCYSLFTDVNYVHNKNAFLPSKHFVKAYA